MNAPLHLDPTTRIGLPFVGLHGPSQSRSVQVDGGRPRASDYFVCTRGSRLGAVCTEAPCKLYPPIFFHFFLQGKGAYLLLRRVITIPSNNLLDTYRRHRTLGGPVLNARCASSWVAQLPSLLGCVWLTQKITVAAGKHCSGWCFVKEKYYFG